MCSGVDTQSGWMAMDGSRQQITAAVVESGKNLKQSGWTEDKEFHIFESLNKSL